MNSVLSINFIIYFPDIFRYIMTAGKYMTYLFVSEDVDIIMSSVDIYLKCIGLFFIPLSIAIPLCPFF